MRNVHVKAKKKEKKKTYPVQIGTKRINSSSFSNRIKLKVAHFSFYQDGNFEKISYICSR